MPRGPDHRKDAECDRVIYRLWDLEDLTRVLSWMREAGRTTFTSTEVRRATEYTTLDGWGIARIRRVLRVGVLVGWLARAGRKYAITRDAIATLPPFEVAISRAIASQPGKPGETRATIRSTLRGELRRAIGGGT